MKYKEDDKEYIEKITKLALNIKVTELKDERLLNLYRQKNNMTMKDLAALLVVVAKKMPLFRKIRFSGGCDLTFGKLIDWFSSAETQFIILHRVYYVIHEQAVNLYDILERDKRLRFAVNKWYQSAESAWESYVAPRRTHSDPTAWYTMQDHLNVMYGMVSPYIEKLYEAVRYNVIAMKWRDVEVVANAQITLMMFNMGTHTFRAFFRDFERACGADLSVLFMGDELTNMRRCFINMVNALGLVVEEGEKGNLNINGYRHTASQRTVTAWDDFINAMRDDDLMDESALRAIEMNPKVKEDYRHVLEEEDKKMMDKGIEQLSEKYLVTKQK